jgi:tripartite ATP-independent transporter DctP family solute receptor
MIGMRNKRSFAKLGFVALIALVLLISACSSGNENKGSTASQDTNKAAKQEVIKMRLGHVFAADSITDQASKRFADLINQKTNGAIEVQVFPAGQLGGDEAIGQSLSRGVQELAFINQGSMAGMDPLLDFHYLPYIAENHEQVDKLFYGDGIIPTTIKETLAKHNMHALGFFDLEFRGLTNSKGPVMTPDDMKGLKLRVPGSRAIKTFFEELGVEAVAIPMPELYTSLQQGVVDGQDNGVIITYDNKLHEPNKYLTRLNHVFATGTIVISKKAWDSLTPEQQKAFEEAGQETQAWQVAENRKLVDS